MGCAAGGHRSRRYGDQPGANPGCSRPQAAAILDYPQAGTKEIFLCPAVRLYQTLEAEGQDTKLDVYEGTWHIFQQTQIPETEVAVGKSAAFINKHLASR